MADCCECKNFEVKEKTDIKKLLLEEIKAVHEAIIRSVGEINGGAVPELVDAQIKLVNCVANGVYL